MSTRTNTADTKTTESHVKLAAPELPAAIRSGGEKRPLAYPHLYQIQAGDWRISYAVEHNRLAILVLEVLNPAGESSKDAMPENMKRSMKIKLLDWPEGAGNRQLPPEVVSSKMKIKWLDMAEEASDTAVESSGGSRIKLKGSAEKKADTARASGKSRITLLDAGGPPAADESETEPVQGEVIDAENAKVTPLDEPSM